MKFRYPNVQSISDIPGRNCVRVLMRFLWSAAKVESNLERIQIKIFIKTPTQVKDKLLAVDVEMMLLEPGQRWNVNAFPLNNHELLQAEIEKVLHNYYYE